MKFEKLFANIIKESEDLDFNEGPRWPDKRVKTSNDLEIDKIDKILQGQFQLKLDADSIVKRFDTKSKYYAMAVEFAKYAHNAYREMQNYELAKLPATPEIVAPVAPSKNDVIFKDAGDPNANLRNDEYVTVSIKSKPISSETDYDYNYMKEVLKFLKPLNNFEQEIVNDKDDDLIFILTLDAPPGKMFELESTIHPQEKEVLEYNYNGLPFYRSKSSGKYYIELNYDKTQRADFDDTLKVFLRYGIKVISRSARSYQVL